MIWKCLFRHDWVEHDSVRIAERPEVLQIALAVAAGVSLIIVPNVIWFVSVWWASLPAFLCAVFWSGAVALARSMVDASCLRCGKQLFGYTRHVERRSLREAAEKKARQHHAYNCSSLRAEIRRRFKERGPSSI